MQLFPILIIVIVLAADGGVRLMQPESPPTTGEAALLAWLPVAVIIAGTWAVITWCNMRLQRGKGVRALGHAERAMRYGRMLLLVSHAGAVLAFGWLDAVRATVGDLILIDELIAIAPPFIGAIGLWWAYYPVERRIRESLLVRRLDLGKPVYPMPTRVQYVLNQARGGLLMLLVPVAAILGIAETIQLAAARWADPTTAVHITNGATLFAAAGVFLFAPLLMRVLLSVERLPEGPVRESLMDICSSHGVRIRELLLWKTSGAMINAAVMGLIGRLRYVLVTDALVETMSSDQLKAVMAHEVGHVRRHHMPWLVVCFVAALFAALWMIELPLWVISAVGMMPGQITGGIMLGLIMAMQLVLALIAFGWVSRRFERQADTFAAQHLSMAMAEEVEEHESQQPQGKLRIAHGATDAMCGALEMIAQLNAVDPQRPSWRHGSIAWRQQYLMSLVGTPVDDVPIDRSIKFIKRVAAVVLVMTTLAWILV